MHLDKQIECSTRLVIYSFLSAMILRREELKNFYADTLRVVGFSLQPLPTPGQESGQYECEAYDEPIEALRVWLIPKRLNEPRDGN